MAALTLDIREHRFPAVGSAPAKTTLCDIKLTVGAGERVAIIGPSGCGKTTLLTIVAGLVSGYSGRLDIAPGTRLAYVFQEPRLLPWRSVEANVSLGARRQSGQHRERVNQLLGEVGLQHVAGAWPHQLSGGMAQRVGLARGLAADPDVLLLDEPFAALDALTRLKMQDLLLHIRERHDQTVVLVTHDIDEAIYLADRILILGDSPAHLVASHLIDLPRPRDRSHPQLVALRDQILHHFGVGTLPERQDTDCPEALAAD
jgi:ABC-type nitrate/sulfonate/bicarbonate transport system ATPase subunit